MSLLTFPTVAEVSAPTIRSAVRLRVSTAVAVLIVFAPWIQCAAQVHAICQHLHVLHVQTTTTMAIIYPHVVAPTAMTTMRTYIPEQQKSAPTT